MIDKDVLLGKSMKIYEALQRAWLFLKYVINQEYVRLLMPNADG